METARICMTKQASHNFYSFHSDVYSKYKWVRFQQGCITVDMILSYLIWHSLGHVIIKLSEEKTTSPRLVVLSSQGVLPLGG